MNMYLAFIIHDISGSKQETEGSKHSKQAACGSSNVHCCRLPSAAATPGGGKAKRRRYPKSLMTRFFASEFFISHFPSTGPHHALSTNLLHCSKVHTLWKRSLHSLDFWPLACRARPATGRRRRMMRARPATGTRRRMIRARWPFIQLQRSSMCVYCVCHLMKSINTLCDDRYSIKVKHATLYVVSHLHTSYRRGIKCSFFNESLHHCIDNILCQTGLN